MTKIGRPRTPEKEQVTVIRLQKKHVDMLDKVIRERAVRDLDAVNIGLEEPVPGTDVSSWTSYVEPINYSGERRKLVAMLIEKGLTDEALYPTRVLPPVPPGPYSNVDFAAIASWAAVESKRLTASAPEAVQDVLARNRLRELKRDLPRKEYLERVRIVTYAKLEERDDEEKAP